MGGSLGSPSILSPPVGVCFSALLSAFLSGLPAEAWRGQGQVMGSSLGGGRTPGAVAMGTAEQHHWLENKQAGSLTSD